MLLEWIFKYLNKKDESPENNKEIIKDEKESEVKEDDRSYQSQ